MNKTVILIGWFVCACLVIYNIFNGVFPTTKFIAWIILTVMVFASRVERVSKKLDIHAVSRYGDGMVL